jgi:hypothetical protein
MAHHGLVTCPLHVVSHRYIKATYIVPGYGTDASAKNKQGQTPLV